MTTGTDDAKRAFRPWLTDGVPASGVNEPDKTEIRAAFDSIGLDIVAASAGGDPNAVRAVIEPIRDDALAAAGFDTRAGAITFAPKMSTGETTEVYGEASSTTRAAVTGEMRLDGTAATAGEQIPLNGRYTKQASGSPLLWRTGNTEVQKSEAVLLTTQGVAASVALAFEILPGPTRRVVIDKQGYAGVIEGRTTFRQPAIDALSAGALPPFTGQALKYARVNASATGLEYATGPSGGGTATPRIRIASNHGVTPSLTPNLSNGTTQVSGTDRLAFRVNTKCKAPRFLFGNGWFTSSTEFQPTGNAIKMVAVFDVPSRIKPISIPGTLSAPLSLGGFTGHVLGDCEIVLSEPIEVGRLVPGTDYFYRVHKVVAAGEKWPYTTYTGAYNWNSASTTTDIVYGNATKDGSDATLIYGNSTAGRGTAFATTGYAFGALAIIAEQISPLSTVLITGDSISAGAGDAIGRGFLVRAMETAGLGYYNAGIGGSRVDTLAGIFARVPQFLPQFTDHVICHAFTNDLTPNTMVFADVQERVLRFFDMYSRPGVKVWMSTILPRTSSTDSWATYANQTKQNFEDLRVQINNWYRDTTGTGCRAYLIANGVPAEQIGGFVDTTPAAERNSDGSFVALDGNGQQTIGTGGYWLVNGTAGYPTADGTHPTTALHILLSALVPTSQMGIS